VSMTIMYLHITLSSYGIILNQLCE